MIPEIELGDIMGPFFDFVNGQFRGVFVAIFGVLAVITLIDYMLYIYTGRD
jgi:hypothetical protein